MTNEPYAAMAYAAAHGVPAESLDIDGDAAGVGAVVQVLRPLLAELAAAEARITAVRKLRDEAVHTGIGVVGAPALSAALGEA